MAKSRLELHKFLCDLLGSGNAYFQPPESIKMKYPAIVYEKSNIQNIFADNSSYKRMNAYSVTVVDENPDSEIAAKFEQLPLCKFDRCFTSDNLNNFVFTLFY